MDRRFSNTFHFNPRRYENQLSFFGRKVLDTMVKKWTVADCNRIQNQNDYSFYPSRMLPHTHCPQDKKVLEFLSKEPLAQLMPQRSSKTCNETFNENNGTDVDKPFDFHGIHKYLPAVPTSNELLKTVISAKDNVVDQDKILTNVTAVAEVNISAHDMINPVIYESKATNMLHDFYNRPVEYDENNAFYPKGRDRVDNTSVFGQSVNWNDMFDTELLPDATTNPIHIIQDNVTRSTTSEQILNKAFSEHANDHDSKSYGSKQTKTKELKQNNVKNTKRKHQLKVTDVIPKKVKKINETEKSKNNFRKQKYTRAVKNWLDDLDSNNLVVEDEIMKNHNSEETSLEGTSKNVITNKITSVNKPEHIVIEKVKENPSKKVVQAQLTNKDGKMKFDKPKDKTETEISPDNIEIDKTDKTKDKKIKPKFIAPIKSQIPVKDVNYKVIVVDGNNIHEHTESLRLVANKELVCVLIYSNGFSQLNKHHTENSCDPEGFIVNFEDEYLYFKGVHQKIKKVINIMLESNRVICYEGKSLLIYFKSNLGLELNNWTMVDVKIGGSLLCPENPPENFTDVQKMLSYFPEYTIATECVLQKTAWYATLLDKCGVRMTCLLKEKGLWSVFVEIEMKLMPVIAEMERRGVTVDLQKLKSMEDIVLSKMKEVEQECYKAAGKTFQLNSAAQIRTILYDDLQLDTKCNVKIKETICKGAKSTSETMLRSLVSVHPLPKLILEYRHLHKAHATFLTGIAQQVVDGVVKPTWVQTAAATGRIASNNPNLQAIPKAPFNLVLFPDENNSGNQSVSIRSVYTSRPGYLLVAADFQHVECRVFAHCAADSEESSAPTSLGRLNKTESEISSEDRERTKRIVYASLYGAGCCKLMDILGVSYEQTLSIMASFNRTFPSLKSFGRSVVSRCEQNGGFLSTLCGRGRRFKNIDSQDVQLKSQAERQAVNFIVQGSAADLCKMAMILTSQRLRSHSPPVDGCLLLQIHDELVWEIRDEHVDTAAGVIKEIMEGCGQQCGMTMSLPVSLSTGNTWGDMADYKPHHSCSK